MQRITAKVQIRKTLEALNVAKRLQPGVLDHLTDRVLTSSSPDDLVAEFAAAERDPKSRSAKQVRKLVRLTNLGPLPPTLGIAESIG